MCQNNDIETGGSSENIMSDIELTDIDINISHDETTNFINMDNNNNNAIDEVIDTTTTNIEKGGKSDKNDSNNKEEENKSLAELANAKKSQKDH